ncbi:MAG TPA: glycosyltransferase, partial [Conexibacter sp.]|nr:glycosyltransferase [Conexibacter sp.]
VRVRAVRRRLDLLIAPSDFVRERHVAYGVVPRERAVTIRHGARAGSRRVRRVHHRRLRIGFIGTLAAHKGVPTLLRAAAAMPPQWTLAVAGAGPLADAVREAAAHDSRVAYAGELDEGGRDAFLDGVDVLAIPSEWEEPATLVAVEAAVRGLPTVVSERGGLLETPYAGSFPAGDAQALLATLAQLADDPGELARCSETLLASSSVYVWPTHVERVEHALAAVAEGS